MIVSDTVDALVTRYEPPVNHRLSLLDEIMVEPGTIKDWELLHELHYKAETVGIGPRFYKVTLNGETIGVGVFTVPKMLLGGRNEVFPHLRPNQRGMDTRLMNKHRAEELNREFCVNSRLVVDTMYRGCGIAYRAQNLMMRMQGKRFVEFQSAMSKFNPFAQKAGIKFAPPRMARNYQKGMQLFCRQFDCNPQDVVAVKKEYAEMPSYQQKKVLEEMKKFYTSFSSMEKSGNNRHKGTSRIDEMDFGKLLINIQQLVFASPLYGVYENPDAGIALPSKISILAFDNQATDEPLKLEML